jgi:biopolymer transport protein ExbD
MAFLRKGFLKSAHRRNELLCVIDLPSVALMVFLPLLVIFMTIPYSHYGRSVDLAAAYNARKLPGAKREDAIRIHVTRDGTVYFGYSRIKSDELSFRINEAVRNGAERRIYLAVDARARYGDLSEVLFQIQKTGIQDVSILADSPRPTVSLSSLPTR